MIKVYIHSYDNKVYENNLIESIYFTSKDLGDRMILVSSSPIISLLDISLIILKTSKETLKLSTSGGILEFSDNMCSLFLETFEFSDALDINKINLDKEKAMEVINNKNLYSKKDLELAEYNLKKAINRLKLVK